MIFCLLYRLFAINDKGGMMVQSKKKEFEEEIIQLAEYAKALSHPVRIKILQILFEKNLCICGDLVNILPLSQSTVSQHLKELKRIGLIKGEIEGPRTCYCVDTQNIKKAVTEFQKLFTKICNCN